MVDFEDEANERRRFSTQTMNNCEIYGDLHLYPIIGSTSLRHILLSGR